MIVAMRRCGQALRARNQKLEGRDAAVGIVPGEQEAHPERAGTDGLVGRVDAEVESRLGHAESPYGKLRLPCYSSKRHLPHNVNAFISQKRTNAQKPTKERRAHRSAAARSGSRDSSPHYRGAE